MSRLPLRVLGAAVLLAIVTVNDATTAAQTGDRTLTRTVRTGRRVALVIGNDSYPRAQLTNAAADARAMAAALREVSFSVTERVNLPLDGFERAVNEFVRGLQPGDVALFYFSGHGIEFEGENYLLPIDFSADDMVQAKRRAVSANEIVERMTARQTRVRLMVLDACRDNPYSGTRAGGGGLAEIPAEGTLIAFATAPRRTASDNPGGKNGLFTMHLLEALREPGLSALEVFRRTRQRVYEASNQRQRPWVHEDLLEDFYFRPKSSPATPAERADRVAPPAPNNVVSGGTTRIPPTPKTPDQEQRACDGGDVIACVSLGARYVMDFEDTVVKQDLKRAIALFKRACDLGNAQGCAQLGHAYEEGWGGAAALTSANGVYERSRVISQKACDSGDATACAQLGVLYEEGSGVTKDYARAAALFQRACERGFAEGCASWGWRLEWGNDGNGGLPQDRERVLSLYRRSCDEGSAKGCLRVGRSYEKGELGVKTDAAAAATFYEKGCDPVLHTQTCAAFERLTGRPAPARTQPLAPSLEPLDPPVIPDAN